MASLNDVLAQLNGGVNQEAATPFTNAVLAEAFEKRQKARSEKLVTVAMEVTEKVETIIAGAVTTLRNVRKQEKVAKENVENLNRAAKYFAATGNPLPFYNAAGRRHEAASYCAMVGAELPQMTDPLWLVPQDWQEQQ